jgi:hypothetical protein
MNCCTACTVCSICTACAVGLWTATTAATTAAILLLSHVSDMSTLAVHFSTTGTAWARVRSSFLAVTPLRPVCRVIEILPSGALHGSKVGALARACTWPWPWRRRCWGRLAFDAAVLDHAAQGGVVAVTHTVVRQAAGAEGLIRPVASTATCLSKCRQWWCADGWVDGSEFVVVSIEYCQLQRQLSWYGGEH